MSAEILLSYNRKPVRLSVSSEAAWLCSADLFAAVDPPKRLGLLAQMAPENLKIVPFASEAGTEQLTAVSPQGVAAIAATLPFPQDRMLDAWCRKQIGRLSEEHGFAPMEYSLTAVGYLPVKPRPADANYLPWVQLRLQVQQAGTRPHPANMAEPALYDDQTPFRGLGIVALQTGPTLA